jgi:hypothetical protein
MIECTHILRPVDFSDTSARAHKYGAALASWYDAQLEVLHLVPAFESPLTARVAAVSGDGHVL